MIMHDIEKSIWVKKGQLWMINGDIDRLKKRKEKLWEEIVELEQRQKEMINCE